MEGARLARTPLLESLRAQAATCYLQEGRSRQALYFLCAEAHGGQEVLAILLIERHPRPCFTDSYWCIANERCCDGFRGTAKGLSRTCAWIQSPPPSPPVQAGPQR